MSTAHSVTRSRGTDLEVTALSLEECAATIVDDRVTAAKEEGRLMGLQEAREGAADLLQAALANLEEAREQTLETVSQDSVALAIEIARQVIHTEIEEQRHNLEAMVRETLSFAEVGRGACVVHVAPADAELLADIPFRSATRIEADPDMNAGDVHVTTSNGTLVREISEALVSIRQRLGKDLT
jgi:flagellar biosynthesis/type III secretory pathway protein FliH